MEAEGRLICLVYGSADHQDGLLKHRAVIAHKGLSDDIDRVRGWPNASALAVFGCKETAGMKTAWRRLRNRAPPLPSAIRWSAVMRSGQRFSTWIASSLPIDNVEISVRSIPLDDGSFQEHVLDDQCVHRCSGEFPEPGLSRGLNAADEDDIPQFWHGELDWKRDGARPLEWLLST